VEDGRDILRKRRQKKLKIIIFPTKKFQNLDFTTKKVKIS